MPIRDLAYAVYARRLRASLKGAELPGHVGLIMDGNRRWARQMGMANPSLGHKFGADHVEDVLSWCEAAGIKHVTVFVCSTENLAHREDAEIAFLMQVIEQVVSDKIATPDPAWQMHIAGLLDALPDSTARALKNAEEVTRSCSTGAHVTLAVAYGGRQEVVDAFRALLHEQAETGGSLADLAETLTAENVARHLYTAGQPDPDLVIRTSGEQRMSNFLLWQSAYSELYFCEAYWPAFREIDFLRALRSYAASSVAVATAPDLAACQLCRRLAVRCHRRRTKPPGEAWRPAPDGEEQGSRSPKPDDSTPGGLHAGSSRRHPKSLKISTMNTAGFE